MPVLQYSLDVRFQPETEKEVFIARISSVRDLLLSEGGKKVDNYELNLLFSFSGTR